MMIHAQRPHPRNDRGFTLTEMAIVLGIAGIIVTGLWEVYGTMQRRNQVRVAAQDIVSIVQNVRTLYAEGTGIVGGYSGGLTAALDQLKVFPADMHNSALCVGQKYGCVFNPWSLQTRPANPTGTLGSVIVVANNCAGFSGMLSPTGFPCLGVVFYYVPNDACIDMIMATNQNGNGLVNIQVNAGGLLTPPVTLATANAACAGVATGNTITNTITWAYLLRSNQ